MLKYGKKTSMTLLQIYLKMSHVQVDVVPRRSRMLAVWLLRFLMVMQAIFKYSDTVLGYFLKFFVVFF